MLAQRRKGYTDEVLLFEALERLVRKWRIT